MGKLKSQRVVEGMLSCNLTAALRKVLIDSLTSLSYFVDEFLPSISIFSEYAMNADALTVVL